MRTVQMTLDEGLVKSVDQAAKKGHTTRSAFTRDALREALRRLEIRQMEARHKLGYRERPVVGDEFRVWEKVQKWGDE